MIGPRFFRSAYRKEPISAFLLVAGSVDTVMGGIGGYGGLAALGLLMVGGAFALRWWQWQRWQKSVAPERLAEYALPPQSSRPLPMLSMAKKQHPPH
ncbi:hypothetical protein L3556_15275 [Candidatus Synechococcus calcipolaris G9]|uniref:Uncharacterized protein n=1 Tax=Candidatus Synechococcus calcipolaris G9 TaxID=1497997 RepID=A0ABT6F383_9SYNE|nr:hypothetical protein [Candidatus Synechococcus calcipolaris]MDG2992279.1 hypothetical protein [Candidatus Synechococcus calcipolaris G9]